MSLSAAARNDLATSVVTGSTYMSLHTGDPADTGANEVIGGAPAYARRAITWSQASNGTVAVAGMVSFDVPGGTTITHFGLWSAATGGAFRSGGVLSAAETLSAQGAYIVTTATATVSSPQT